ncbi:MAG: HupE/UreJ family protein [Rhodospirillaceae bacterium]
MFGRHFVAIVGAALALGATTAHAHTFGTTGFGFMEGIAHPISGIDHIMAMVAVGLWASQEGGRALWALPATFVSMMTVGALLGVAGVPVPAVELGIAASVLVLGSLIAASARLPLIAAMAIVGACAVMHGHAHGAEMPEAAAPILYGIGFVLGTSILHTIGVAVGYWARSSLARVAVRVSGGAIAVAGVALMVG